MKKSKLLNFISKYNLGGTVESVIWNVKNGEFSVRFISEDSHLLAEIIMKNLSETIMVNGKEMNGEVAELGVYATSQLVKLLNVVDDDVNLSLVKADRGKHGEAYGSFKIEDKSDIQADVNFMLTETSVIRSAPAIDELPEFDLKLILDKNFKKKFIKGKNALPDDEIFTIITTNDKVKVVIGHQTVNTNRVTILPEIEGDLKKINNISFNSTFLKEILMANSEAETSVLNISEQGLAVVEFNTADFDAKYYLVAQE